MKMLTQETDEAHGLSMTQILEKLEEQGIAAERKSIYRDIDTLREYGMDIRCYQRAPVEYALAKRDFELSQLLLLVDAIQSSRFLTQSQSEDLVQSVKGLASVSQQKLLDKRLHVEGRIKMQNESVFYSVDRIQEALAAHKRVSFTYFKYNAAKLKIMQHEGRLYTETPVELIYSDGYYYMVAYNEKHDTFLHYRVDRMDEINVVNQPALRNERIANFDAEELESSVFGMYSGEPVKVTLLVSDEAMGAVIDRFGSELDSVPCKPNQARVYAHVVKSPVFFGWLAQFENRVRIEKPLWLAKEYQAYLAAIVHSYNQ